MLVHTVVYISLLSFILYILKILHVPPLVKPNLLPCVNLPAFHYTRKSLCLSSHWCSLGWPIYSTYWWDCVLAAFFVTLFSLHPSVPDCKDCRDFTLQRFLPYGVCLTERGKSIWHRYVCTYFKPLLWFKVIHIWLRSCHFSRGLNREKRRCWAS